MRLAKLNLMIHYVTHELFPDNLDKLSDKHVQMNEDLMFCNLFEYPYDRYIKLSCRGD